MVKCVHVNGVLGATETHEMDGHSILYDTDVFHPD